MKIKLTAFLVSACFSSVVTANSVNQNDLDEIFTSTNGASHVIHLSDKEMSETKGAYWWLVPMLISAGIIAPRVAITSAQVSQILRRVSITQVLNSTKSYRTRNQVKQIVRDILN